MSLRVLSALVTIGFLLVAIFFRLPYGFYTMLRFVVTIYCGYVAYTFYKLYDGKNYLYVLYGMLAILFNPIIPIHLDRESWQIIDLLMVILLIIPFLFSNFRNKDK